MSVPACTNLRRQVCQRRGVSRRGKHPTRVLIEDLIESLEILDEEDKPAGQTWRDALLRVA